MLNPDMAGHIQEGADMLRRIIQLSRIFGGFTDVLASLEFGQEPVCPQSVETGFSDCEIQVLMYN